LAALAVFAAQFAVLDLALRRPPMRVWVPCAVASFAMWALAASIGERRLVRAFIALVAALVLVVQVLFFRYYHVFLDDGALLAARHMWGDVAPVVVRLLPVTLVCRLGGATLDYACLSMAARLSARQAAAAFVIFACALFLSPPLRDASPDVCALASVRVLFRGRVAHAAASVDVPRMTSRRARVPSVLFILDESVRATDYAPDTTPETTALTQGRVDLREMRSVASYTAIAVSSLLTSLPPTTRKDELDHAPYLFDFARSVGRAASRVHVAYLSAQTDSLFERRDVRTATDVFVTVDDLVGHRVEDSDDVLDLDVDRLLAERAEREIAKLDKPMLAMVHLSGTHAPYFVDDAHAPFKPYSHTVAWSGLSELHTAYRDAIFDQDAAVARVVRAFFAATRGEPSLVVFTSDHGEAFGEHAAIHHGQSLYDEQIHVPMWILARDGALDPSEAMALVAHASDFVTHLDVVPTILDAFGVLDALAMREYASRFAGHSLLRDEPRADGSAAGGTSHTRTVDVVPVTNCTDMFPCPVRTWGLLSGERALVAQPWDGTWRCVDLRTEIEQTDDPACMALRVSSHAYFTTLPNGAPN
jgi:hypothetical protein